MIFRRKKKQGNNEQVEVKEQTETKEQVEKKQNIILKADGTFLLETMENMPDEELKQLTDEELRELEQMLLQEERERFSKERREGNSQQIEDRKEVGDRYYSQLKRIDRILIEREYELKYEYEKVERQKWDTLRFMNEDRENAYQEYHRLINKMLMRIEIMKTRLSEFKKKVNSVSAYEDSVANLLVREYDYLVKEYGVKNLLEFVYENPEKAIEIAESLQGNVEELVNQLKAKKPEAEKKRVELLKKIEEIENQVEQQIKKIEEAKEQQIKRIMEDSQEIQKLKEENKRLTKQLDQLIAENPQAEAIRLLWKRVQGLSEMVGVLVETQQTSITMQDLMRKMQAKMMGKEIEFTPYEKKAMLAKDVKEFKSAITGKDEQIEKVESEARKQINSLKKMKDRVLSVLKKELEEVEDQIAVIMYLPAIEKGKNITDLNKRYLNYYKKLLKRMDKASKQQLKYEMERLTKYYKIMHYNLDQIKDYHHFTEEEVKELVLTFAVAVEYVIARHPYYEASLKELVDYIYEEIDYANYSPTKESLPTVENLYQDLLKEFNLEIDHLEFESGLTGYDTPRMQILIRQAFTAGLMLNRIAEHVIKVMELASKKPFELPVLKEKMYKRVKDNEVRDKKTVEDLVKYELKRVFGAEYTEQTLKEFFLGVLPATYPERKWRPYWEKPIESNSWLGLGNFTKKILLNNLFPFLTPPDDLELQNKEVMEELKKRGIIAEKGAER